MAAIEDLSERLHREAAIHAENELIRLSLNIAQGEITRLRAGLDLKAKELELSHRLWFNAKSELAALRAKNSDLLTRMGDIVTMNLSLGLDNIEYIVKQEELYSQLDASQKTEDEARDLIERAKVHNNQTGYEPSWSRTGVFADDIDAWLTAHPKEQK